MINLKTGKEIIAKEFSEFPIGEIIDIGGNVGILFRFWGATCSRCPYRYGK